MGITGSSNPVLCDKTEGRDGVGGRREVQKEGTPVYRQLIHVDVWLKSPQYCKAIILQLKINKFILKKISGGLKKKTSTLLKALLSQ